MTVKILCKYNVDSNRNHRELANQTGQFYSSSGGGAGGGPAGFGLKITMELYICVNYKKSLNNDNIRSWRIWRWSIVVIQEGRIDGSWSKYSTEQIAKSIEYTRNDGIECWTLSISKIR